MLDHLKLASILTKQAQAMLALRRALLIHPKNQFGATILPEQDIKHMASMLRLSAETLDAMAVLHDGEILFAILPGA